ncbi:hypothetical protein K493DRAFT_302753 [Basidiobolus meristosporus CBS 931.73]|uniref:Uncharacterized protein n=1 Tax=Basidiobolus meristosporus CBS 931.73 TaxID=1314790 RepID=A0A1Y1Y6X5_9FUNG|nr:hypothetical protein K493DRAFT_302753 [Basidiobolus meristosporus CBS 931.73]|eukprot:ORX93334.1 hypothetical protein K493DRAFT_302753 [Basidiobolus meristosporus CBS 931.73]
MPSNHFTQSITYSFRKLLSNRFIKRSSSKHTETSASVEGKGEALESSEAAAWEPMTLHIPRLENVRVTQILQKNEKHASHDSLSNQASFWVKRTALDSDKRGAKTNIGMPEFQPPLNGCEKPQDDSSKAVSLEKQLEVRKNCESCYTVPKSPKKRCPCEFERAQSKYLEDQKPKKSVFITGSLLKSRKSARALSGRKGPSGDTRLIGALFSGRKQRKQGDLTKRTSTSAHTRSSESVECTSPEFESKLQKVESFERMIIDPNYQNETIRLALTPNLLS